MPRDDFNIDTKRSLALRAGYQCSICSRLTAGPSEESISSVNQTGVAAHICAAAPGGRRYDKNQTPAQRKSIENAIWLCSFHADLIDGDEVEYTIGRLNTIKTRHENRIKLQQSGINTEQGQFTKFEIGNFGSIRQAITLQLTKRNIILGDNGVGKTLICEMIASLANKKRLNRWHKPEWDKDDGYCNMWYCKGDISKFSISISQDNKTKYKLNDVRVPFLDAPCAIFYPRWGLNEFINRIRQKAEKRGIEAKPADDIVYWVARYFKLNRKQLGTVLASMAYSKKYFASGIKINKKENTLDVKYGFERNSDYHDFRGYSGGEKQRILFEICLQIAIFYSKFKPVILLLENTSFGTIDITGLNKILQITLEEDFPFQFIFTSMEKKNILDTRGYMLTELTKKDDGKGIIAVQTDETLTPREAN